MENFKSVAKSVNNFVNNRFRRNAEASTQHLVQASQPESDVELAGKEIDRALLMINEGNTEEVVTICKAVREKTINNGDDSEVKEIKNRLFEAGLEIALAGHKETAIKVLQIADSSAYTGTVGYPEVIFHSAAHACWTVLNSAAKPWALVSGLMHAITENPELKCAPYFLGKVLAQGLYGVKKDLAKAQQYFQIATERGYEPGKHVYMNSSLETYRLMKEGQQSANSVFATVPLDVINHIARLKVEARLAELKFTKETPI